MSKLPRVRKKRAASVKKQLAAISQRLGATQRRVLKAHERLTKVLSRIPTPTEISRAAKMKNSTAVYGCLKALKRRGLIADVATADRGTPKGEGGSGKAKWTLAALKEDPASRGGGAAPPDPISAAVAILQNEIVRTRKRLDGLVEAVGAILRGTDSGMMLAKGG